MAEQNVMSRIMKLMERANHPETPEAERNLCMDRAEKMMVQHQIDRADLKPESKSSIVQDTWDLNVGEVDSEFRYHIRDLMLSVLRHCGVRVHPKESYAPRDDGTTDYRVKRYTLVGFPEDMRYAEMIWFRVFKEFVTNISPKWDAKQPLSDNVYTFIKAGYSWIDTYRIARRAQYGEWPEQMPNGGPRLRKAYKDALETRGETFSKTRTREAYRTTFVQSYSSTISRRLDEMRRKAKESVGDSDRYALAVRSTKEKVDEEFYRMFPEYDPAVIRRMQEAEKAELLAEWNALSDEDKKAIAAWAEAEKERTAKVEAEWHAKWVAREKRAERSRRNYGSVREKTTYDHSAWERGQQVASKVNLNVDGEVKTDKKGELT
jgi:hypothetical protein